MLNWYNRSVVGNGKIPMVEIILAIGNKKIENQERELRIFKKKLRTSYFAIISHPIAGKTTIMSNCSTWGDSRLVPVKGRKQDFAKSDRWIEKQGFVTSSVMQFDYDGKRQYPRASDTRTFWRYLSYLWWRWMLYAWDSAKGIEVRLRRRGCETSWHSSLYLYEQADCDIGHWPLTRIGRSLALLTPWTGQSMGKALSLYDSITNAWSL